MRFWMEIAGVRFCLSPAAISALRYRCEEGDSLVNHLAACATATELEGRLLRMVRAMIAEDRPELPELGRLARRDGAFLEKALAARDALLADDPRRAGGEEGGRRFDEYDILALMAAARMDMGLLYELPILHIVSAVGRYFELRGAEEPEYHEMDAGEMAKLYPR